MAIHDTIYSPVSEQQFKGALSTGSKVWVHSGRQMQTFILKRLFQGVMVLLLLTFLVFLVMRLLPGDPILLYFAQGEVAHFTPEQLEALRAEFGLDKPL